MHPVRRSGRPVALANEAMATSSAGIDAMRALFPRERGVLSSVPGWRSLRDLAW